PLTPPRAVAIITQIASALDAAHAAGVMHRDVKPPNILVTRDDFAYLVDFGIASATTDEKLTQLGTAVGTWKYMAPERFSTDEVTYRADIYALGCVLYEALTGAAPYRADSASVLVTAHLMDPIPQASAKRSGIPRALDAVIARGMAKKPEDRYASAGDLALAAHEALSDPDQDHAANIVRRSREASIPGGAATVVPPATLAGTGVAPPPTTPPPGAHSRVVPPTVVPQTPVPPTVVPPTVVPPTVAPRQTYTPPPPTPVQQPHYPGPASSGPLPRPAPQQPPYPGPASSGPLPRPAPARPAWAPDSGPVPTPSGPVPGGQYYQASNSWAGQPPGPPHQPGGPPSWNQAQPPAKGRNPWPIIAAVAGVLIVVVGGLAVYLLIPDPKPPPKPIAAERLPSLLLSASEINSIMGATSMTPGDPITTMSKASSLTLSQPSCLGVLYATQDPTYANSGYSAVNGLVSNESGDSMQHFVHQAVVSFPTADKASDFLKTSEDAWKGCAGKTITVTNSGKTFRWAVSSVSGGPPRITLVNTQEGAKDWQCQRALSQVNNVIVDVNACAYQINDKASQVSDKISDKINNE
ncbi:serine/threonine-protein kinase PknH/PknJ, partial [Mycobacterium sp.]|uniref:serine/threonine-protein kinase PknH/PknJ n=1 Tax=Mycobacterium sp. TaxID=1785 RepID=UPI002BC3A6A4